MEDSFNFVILTWEPILYSYHSQRYFYHNQFAFLFLKLFLNLFQYRWFEKNYW